MIIFRIIGQIVKWGIILFLVWLVGSIVLGIVFGISDFWFKTPYEDGVTIDGVRTNGELLEKKKKEIKEAYKLIEIDSTKNK